MKIGVFQTHAYEQPYLQVANEEFQFDLKFFEPRLNEQTVDLAKGCDVICSFANDRVNREVIEKLRDHGVKLIATRSAGYNHIDIEAAKAFGIPVVRVPEYSPNSVAEHAVGLILCLNRKIHRAYQRVREQNFSLNGLVGFDIKGKKVGVIGVGRIGKVFAQIMHGFGATVLGFDLEEDAELKAKGVLTYVDLRTLYSASDIISLHVPLTPSSLHLINEDAFGLMKKGVLLINTSRGGLIDSKALISNLKTGKVGSAGLDVYEEEGAVFFENHSEEILHDDVLARLMTFPNVLITSHQGFLTAEALGNIATTTLKNIDDFCKGRPLANKVEA